MTKLINLCTNKNTALSEIENCLLDNKHVDNYINIKDSYGATALMYAIYNKNIDAVKYFVKNGADVNVKDNLNNTAFMLADFSNCIEIVEYLKSVQNKQSINIETICINGVNYKLTKI